MSTAYPIADYLIHRGWHPMGAGGRSGRCPMPWHNDHNPSFQIYYDHATCFNCFVEGVTLPKLILMLEFGDNEACWSDAYERAKNFGYVSNNPLSDKPAQRETCAPTPQEQAFLAFMRDWWHAMLMSEQWGSPGRDYFLRRGVPMATLLRQKNLGYHPGSLTAQIALADYAYAQFGPVWLQLALSTAVLCYDGIRLWDRVMFSCEWDNAVLFYQGRTLGEEHPKYQSPWRLNKVPFTLPIASPQYANPILTESPFGPAALEQDNIPVLATMGSQVHHIIPYLKGYDGPFPLGQDNDEAKYQFNKSVCAGDNQAERLAKVLREAGYDSFRLRPEGVPGGPTKDLDGWRLQCGIAPLRQALLDQSTASLAKSVSL